MTRVYGVYTGNKMADLKPAKVFTTLKSDLKRPQTIGSKVSETYNSKTHEFYDVSLVSPPRDVQVCSSADCSMPPDRCRTCIFISSKKEEVQDAKNSVARRLEYVLQVLNNHQVKVRRNLLPL